jgi:2',3'-cyclic-nucleotide 2'-phosphodiesterase / 3'-nucleotidase / 5'-nucleotidase
MVSQLRKPASSDESSPFTHDRRSAAGTAAHAGPSRRLLPSLVVLGILLGAAPALAFGTPSLSKIGSFTNADGSGAENTAYDPVLNRLFVTNTESNTVDVLALRDPTVPVPLFSISAPAGTEVTDIDVRRGILVAALASPIIGENGSVAFYAWTGALLKQIEVGVGPDEVQFSPDGRKVVVVNSGEADFEENPLDPTGSINLIDLSKGLWRASVQTVNFFQFDGEEDALRAAGIRIRPNAAASVDLTPEGAAFASHRELWVAFQQNNALAVIQIGKWGLEIERLVPLGVKDHSLPGNGLDASDRDDAINIQNWPVFGLYTPDEIASFEVRGKTYFIITNEGDPRDIPLGDEPFQDETTRVEDLADDGLLDPDAFDPDLADRENLGRLQVSRWEGDTDGDGDHDVLYAFGARSFSILDDHGKLVWDSGDQFEQIVAKRVTLPIDEFTLFNAPVGENAFDDRSDNRGPQPEGIAIGRVKARTYAFISLHTQGGVMAYDVSNPYHARFVDYINTRDPGPVAGGDLGTKGLSFIRTWTGKVLIAAACSESGTVAIYEFATRH